MKGWITAISIFVGWLVAVFLCLQGANLYFRNVLIKNHGRDLGLSLWREWKL